MSSKKTSLRLVAATGLMIGVLPQAFALGTLAGTTISNTASVDYEVGGVNQTDVNSLASTFLVDRRINVTVAEVGGLATIVVPGATAQVTTFTVSNTSNAILDYGLLVTQDTSGATTAFGGTDSFDVTLPVTHTFVESGATAGYQPVEDTATFSDEHPVDGTRTVYVVVNIPASAVNNDIAGITLTAIAAQSTDGTGAYVATPGVLAANAAQTNTGSADDPAFIDTVFGDVAGDTDALRDGRHSDDDQYNVVTAAITVTKSSSVISDPFNGISVNAKAIPGAVVEYCLDINNTGAAAAGTIVLTDAIPTNTQFVANSLRTAVTGAGAACTSGTGMAEDDDDAGADETDPDGADYNATTAGAITVTTPSIAAVTRFKATFQVTVD